MSKVRMLMPVIKQLAQNAVFISKRQASLTVKALNQISLLSLTQIPTQERYGLK
jgi:3-hydroxyisobutyrate dehydrogenase-like beta-hydroxyacid dehydrogenase